MNKKQFWTTVVVAIVVMTCAIMIASYPIASHEVQNIARLVIVVVGACLGIAGVTVADEVHDISGPKWFFAAAIITMTITMAYLLSLVVIVILYFLP